MTARPLSVSDGDRSAVVPAEIGVPTAPVHALVTSAPILTSAPMLTSAPGRPPRWQLLARSDAVVALAVILTVGLLWPTGNGVDRTELVQRGALALGCWLLLEACLWGRGVYARARRHLVVSASGEAGTIVSAVIIAILVALAGRQVLPQGVRHIDPIVLVVSTLALCGLALPAARAVMMATYRETDVDRPRILVVGSGATATDAAARLERAGHTELIGFVDDDPLGGQPVLGGIHALPAVCYRRGVDRVLVVTPHRHRDRTEEALRALPASVSVHVVPPYLELTGWRAAIEDLGGLTVVDVDAGSTGPMVLAAKRAMDVAVAVVGLVAMTPVLMAVAAAVRLSSPGPILFRQERIGRHGKPFRILKFRSMLDDLSRGLEGPVVSDERDRQVTAVGRLLRRTGLDEVPQLVNVIRGHMSLVGPRPLIPGESEAVPPSMARRFDVRPGMTGLWQICGQHDLRWDEMCRLDVAYVVSWSFATDLRILAETPRRLVHGGGAIGTRWQAPTD